MLSLIPYLLILLLGPAHAERLGVAQGLGSAVVRPLHAAPTARVADEAAPARRVVRFSRPVALRRTDTEEPTTSAFAESAPTRAGP